MIIVSANIRNNPAMPRTYVRDDLDDIRSLRPGVVGLQEIVGKDDYRPIVARAFAAPRWRLVARRRPVPLVVDAERLRVVSVHRRLMVPGVARLTPTRWVTWAVVEHTRRPALGRWVVMNTHYVSSAWSNRKRSTKRLRQTMWTQHWRRQRSIIRRLNRRGLSVIVTGDFNRGPIPRFTDRQKTLARHGIDHILLCPAPGGVRVKATATGVRRGHSDHPALWARVQLR